MKMLKISKIPEVYYLRVVSSVKTFKLTIAIRYTKFNQFNVHNFWKTMGWWGDMANLDENFLLSKIRMNSYQGCGKICWEWDIKLSPYTKKM